MCDVMDVDRRAVDYLDWKIVKIFDRDSGAIQRNDVFEFADFLRSCWDDQVLLNDCILNILRR